MEATTIPTKVTAKQAYAKALEAEAKANKVDDITDNFINGNPRDVNSVGAKTILYDLKVGMKRVEDKIDNTNKLIITLVITISGGVILYFLTSLLPKIVEIVGVVH
jgi:hypothetical protein